MDMEQIETEVMTPWGATTVKTFREAAGLDQNRRRDELNAWGNSQALGQDEPMTYGTGIGAKQAALGSLWKHRERMEAEAIKPLEFNKIPLNVGFDLGADSTSGISIMSASGRQNSIYSAWMNGVLSSERRMDNEERSCQMHALLDELARRNVELNARMFDVFGPDVWATQPVDDAAAKEYDHNAAMIERDGPPAPRKAEPAPAIEPVSEVKPALHFPVAEMGHKFGGWGA